MTDPIDGWWESPALAFAEGARVGFERGLAEALEIAADLYGPWKFDADAVVRALAARGRWPLPPDPGDGPAGEATPQHLAEPHEVLRTHIDRRHIDHTETATAKPTKRG